MLGSATLEVVIGIALVFLLVSSICTAVREGLESILKTRAAYLEIALRQLLHDADGRGLVEALFEHPLIRALYFGKYTKGAPAPTLFARGGTLPSYIPAASFAAALMDIAVHGRATDLVSSDPRMPVATIAALRANVLNLENPQVQRVMLGAIDAAHGDPQLVKQKLERWFDSAMERVAGWYKRTTQWVLLLIGLIVTVGLNVDCIAIAEFLYKNEFARVVIDGKAHSTLSDPESRDQNAQELREELAALALPIGWGAPVPGGQWVRHVLGWLLTAVAATLGAPFWFDVLNRVTSVRSTVKPRSRAMAETTGQPLPDAVPIAVLPAAPVVEARETERELIALPRDLESAFDGCDVPIDQETPDEHLPVAVGGVG
jgi:hypothetical protein